MRRVLVKDPNQRISWDELFNTYHITEQGEIVNKRDLMVQQQQMELRSSIRSTNGMNGYGYSNRVLGPNNGLTIQTQGVNFSNNPSMNFSSPKSGYMIPSPVNGNLIPFNRSMDFNAMEAQNAQSPIVEKNLITKRSPTKYQPDLRNTSDYRSGLNLNSSSSTNTTNNNSQGNNTQLQPPQRLSSY